jgi:hypothetical protein
MIHLYRSATPSSVTAPACRVASLGHPEDVLLQPDLTKAEKRAILASWASDAHAVPDQPGLRRLDSGAVVDVDEVLRALRALDGADDGRRPPTKATSRRRRPGSFRVFLTRRRDDDDPPPAPAAAFPLGMELALRRKWDGCGEPDPLAA